MKVKVTKSKERFGADDWDVEDDDIEGAREWDLQAKLNSDAYSSKYCVEFENGEGFDLRYVQRNGLRMPMKFYQKTGLGVRVPSSNFNVNDVKQCVGARRLVDVMDVRTQKAIVMTMKDWCRYYNSPVRDRLLNVISLEFSHTKLDNYVESPTIVRQIDWLDRVWPQYRRELQTSATNDLATMMYPKVRKYVLMSVKGCYTDFHVDFGGTSVWYHVLRGEKIFWLIPPTENNLQAFEEWSLSGDQCSVFFPDVAEGCERVHLSEGNTFFIPPGWIHGVYTPEDSLVFGGNFLHTFGVRHQLRVWELEDRTHVKPKFRYPYFIELHWYALARYVACLLHANYLVPIKLEDKKEEEAVKEKKEEEEEEKEELKKEPQDQETSDGSGGLPKYEVKKEFGYEFEHKPFPSSKEPISQQTRFMLEEKFRYRRALLTPTSSEHWIHLSKLEVENLQLIISWLRRLSKERKRLPEDVRDHEELLRDAQLLVNAHHEDDFFGRAISGVPVLRWPPAEKSRRTREPREPKPSAPRSPTAEKGPSRRRIRCRRCEPCRRAECRECHFCRDMVKFAGPGVMRQCCVQKQCLAPQLPGNALCAVCGQMTRATEEEREAEDYEPSRDLFECGVCWEIVHPKCLRMRPPEHEDRNINGVEGVRNEDLPNYWQCPLCVKAGRGWSHKSRVPKGLLFLRALENAAMEGGEGLDAGGGLPAVARLMSGRPRGAVGRPQKRTSVGEETEANSPSPPAKKRGRPKKLRSSDSPPVLQREPLEGPFNPSPAASPPFPLTRSPSAPPLPSPPTSPTVAPSPLPSAAKPVATVSPTPLITITARSAPTITLSPKVAPSSPPGPLTITVNAKAPSAQPPMIVLSPKLPPAAPPTITLSARPPGPPAPKAPRRAPAPTITVSVNRGPPTVMLSAPPPPRPPPKIVVHYIGPDTAVTKLEEEQEVKAPQRKEPLPPPPNGRRRPGRPPKAKLQQQEKEKKAPPKEKEARKTYIVPVEAIEDRFEDRIIMRTATRRYIQKPKRFIEEGNCWK